MNKFLLLLFVYFLSHNTAFAVYPAQTVDYRTAAPVLDAAENFFISLKNSEQGSLWDLLTEKSRSVIVSDVYRASKGMNIKLEKEDVARDFDTKGVMYKNYWTSFASTFDTDMILEHSRWEIGFVKDGEAEIIITYKKSQRPTRLIMLKEEDAWKVGLVETFWSRKAANFLKKIF